MEASKGARVTFKNIHIPDYREVLEGCAEFVKRERRDAMYKIATFIVSKFWNTPTNVSDGLGVLLLTWNQAFYRYGRFDFDKLEYVITKWKVEFNDLRQRNIDSLKPGDENSIRTLFSELLDALQIAEGKNRGNKSPVAVAKALHLLAPDFFPLWDNDMAKAYGCYWVRSGQAPIYYVKFIKVIREVIDQVIAGYIDEHGGDREDAVRDICEKGSRPFKKPLLKLIDEYNYARYSKPWFKFPFRKSTIRPDLDEAIPSGTNIEEGRSMRGHGKIEFSVQRIATNPAGIAIVSFKKASRDFFPRPGEHFTLVIDNREYSTSIRNLKRTGWTSIAKTSEHGVRITRYDLCSRHKLEEGDKVFIEVEIPFERYRLLR